MILISILRKIAKLLNIDMKVLMLTEGGKDYGFGHITRTVSLYQAFESRGILPEILVHGDDSVRGLLKNIKYEIMDWVKDGVVRKNLFKKNGIVIIDSYLARYMVYREASDLAKVPVYIDDNNRINYPRGIVVNGNIYARELGYPINKTITYLLGIKYLPLRKAFWQVRKRKIKKKIGVILVTFGGGDTGKLIKKILEFLVGNYADTKKIIIGNNFNNFRGLTDMKDDATELRDCPDAEKIKESMLEADMAIAGGGQTLYELARLGLPTLGICLIKNQLRNIEAFRKRGLLEYIGWPYENGLLFRIKEFIDHSSYISRIRMHRISTGYVDGYGALRVVGQILKANNTSR